MRPRQPESRRSVVFVFLALWACSPVAAEAARLHVVIATDRAEPGIGPDMEISRDAFLTSVVLNTPQAQCEIWEINPNTRRAQQEFQSIQAKIHSYGKALNRGTMLGAIQGLRVGPEDAVLFYYCGHGAYSPTSGTYTLPSGDGGQPGLLLSQIRNAIAQKRPRFAAVILDCCNRLRPLRGEPRPSVPFAQHRAEFSPLFTELFFSKPGVLTVTSSSPREYSLIVPAIHFGRGEQHFGALFTKIFSSELLDSMENSLRWDDLFRRVQQNLDDEFGQICKQGMIPLGNGKSIPQARQTISYRW